MNSKFKVILILLAVIEVFLLGYLFLGDVNVQVLNPKGPIAREQRDLGLTAISLMLVVAIPLLTTLYVFAYRYRASSKKQSYKPDIRYGKFTEPLWWFIPSLFIFVLAVITWNKTHQLNPYSPLNSNVPAVRIQVVALQWKWLFLYPEYGIATINHVQFPEKTPVNFELTSDAPMNSFWIPSLSGQIYAMTGMSTKLHIMADSVGNFPGVASEISGRGFSGMKFVATSSTRQDFDEWIGGVKSSSNILNASTYENLAKPSENNPVMYYSSYEKDLYNRIMGKYMSEISETDEGENH